MSHHTLQKLMVRMLFDEEFVEDVYAAPGRALAGLDLTEVERSQLLGVDRTDANGHWKVALGNRLSSGVYYSRAPLYGSAALGITCRPDKSQIAVVD